MIQHPKRAYAACLAALLLSLAGCGGGGGSASTDTEIPTTTPVATGEIRGVAATGAPFDGAQIVVWDQRGAVVCATPTDSAGAYTCTLSPTAKAPLVIEATRGDQILYSVTTTTGGTVNVTPLTTVVAAQLTPDGDPSKLRTAITKNPETVTAATVQKEVDELLKALQPLLDALQLKIDPMSGTFAADGTGQDKLLDAIAVSVRPDGTAANIEITVKAVPSANDAAPMSIAFRSDTTTVPTLPAVTAAQLDGIPTPAMVADLLTRMTSCYALPASQRVKNGVDDGVTTGSAADVTATVCRGLFLNDDPASYYSNGNQVGRDASNRGAFAGLFRSGATGLTWDRGNFEFFRSNGDIVLSYRTVDSKGNIDNDTLAVRKVNGTLKLVGNGYAYAATVRPFSENRELINSPQFSSYTTGYNISIDNRTSNGSPVFAKVEVTTPLGTKLTYVPTAGLSQLVAKDGETVTGNPVYRLAAAYQNAATSGNPSEKETFFIASPQLTEDSLRALKDQSVWKLEFFHADPSVANVTQTYRTLSRAQTIAEIRQTPFVALTADMRSVLQDITSKENTGSDSGAFFWPEADPAAPNVLPFETLTSGDAWVVPTGALAPTTFTAYGRAPTVNNVQGARYNDSVGVAKTARTALLYCSKQSANDTHCDPTDPQQYAEGTTLNMFELWVRNARQIELSKKIATYKLQ